MPGAPRSILVQLDFLGTNIRPLRSCFRISIALVTKNVSLCFWKLNEVKSRWCVSMWPLGHWGSKAFSSALPRNPELAQDLARSSQTRNQATATVYIFWSTHFGYPNCLWRSVRLDLVRFGSATIGAATSHWLVGKSRILSKEEDSVRPNEKLIKSPNVYFFALFYLRSRLWCRSYGKTE